MKLKYYVRGLGIGIVFATILCVVSVKGNKMSDNEIIQRARELGMVMEDEVNIFENVKELDKESDSSDVTKEDTTKDNESVPESSVSESESSSEENSSSDTTNESSESDTTQEQTTQESQQTQTPQTDVIHNISVEIVSGMDSGKVAFLLYSAGLVDDASAFNDYLVNNNYANNIRTGTYTIQEGSSYETIAKMLTSN